MCIMSLCHIVVLSPCHITAVKECAGSTTEVKKNREDSWLLGGRAHICVKIHGCSLVMLCRCSCDSTVRPATESAAAAAAAARVCSSCQAICCCPTLTSDAKQCCCFCCCSGCCISRFTLSCPSSHLCSEGQCISSNPDCFSFGLCPQVCVWLLVN